MARTTVCGVIARRQALRPRFRSRPGVRKSQTVRFAMVGSIQFLEELQMPFCVSCGAQLRESAKFCNHCGTPVAPASRPTAASDASALGNPVAAQTSEKPTVPNNAQAEAAAPLDVGATESVSASESVGATEPVNVAGPVRTTADDAVVSSALPVSSPPVAAAPTEDLRHSGSSTVPPLQPAEGLPSRAAKAPAQGKAAQPHAPASAPQPVPQRRRAGAAVAVVAGVAVLIGAGALWYIYQRAEVAVSAPQTPPTPTAQAPSGQQAQEEIIAEVKREGGAQTKVEATQPPITHGAAPVTATLPPSVTTPKGNENASDTVPAATSGAAAPTPKVTAVAPLRAREATVTPAPGAGSVPNPPTRSGIAPVHTPAAPLHTPNTSTSVGATSGDLAARSSPEGTVPSQAVQPTKTIDEQFRELARARCGSINSVVQKIAKAPCTEPIRFELCKDKWSENPPPGMSICKASTTNTSH